MIEKKYSAIVFDLGQVIVPFDYKLFVEKVNLIRPGAGERFLELYNQNYQIHKDFEKGNLSESQFIDQMLGFLDHIIGAEAFCNYWAGIFSVNENIVDILYKLKKNYKLYLLSNTNSIHKKYGFQNFEFLKLFDHLFLSYEIGFIKPEKECYKAVEKVSGFPPGEHIFIDDIPEYVDAAKSFGWDGIQFKGFDDLVINLKKRNIL